MAYQIPPEAPHFVDRDSERARAFGAVAEWDGRSRPLCLALRGPAGIGKTELAFAIARELRPGYPDGVLYLDLDDLRRNGAVSTDDALGGLLRSLRVEPVSASLADRSRQYWTRTESSRLIVIIDNARYGSEIVPLLPASGDSLVIVTSHGPLHDLEAGAAVDLALPPLDERHAVELLRRITDDPRLTAEPEAVAGLVSLCSGLPVALRVAGGWLRRRSRRPLSRLLAELTSELHEKGLPVEKVWDAAYSGLGPDGALLYRLLAVSPGPTFTPEAAAALLGRGQDAADEALEDLETAGLLDTRDVLDTRDERKRLPGLLRAHAQRRARQDGDAREADEARQRIVRWYLRQAQRADARAAGERLTLADPVPPAPGTPDVTFETKPHAYRWLEAERHALYDCVGIAHRYGLDAEVWALAEPLWTHYLDHPHYTDVIDAFRTAVEAARRAERIDALVRMRCQLARPLWEQGRFEEAAEQLDLAMGGLGALDASDRNRKLGASAVEFRGMLSSARGDWDAAAADFETSREMHLAIPNPYGVMLQTYRLGEALAALGELERAATLLAQAHESAATLRRERMTARTGFALGGVLRRLGRLGEARALYEASLASARERGAGRDEARVLDAFADLADEEGNGTEAREHRAAARAVRERLGDAGPGDAG